MSRQTQRYRSWMWIKEGWSFFSWSHLQMSTRGREGKQDMETIQEKMKSRNTRKTIKWPVISKIIILWYESGTKGCQMNGTHSKGFGILFSTHFLKKIKNKSCIQLWKAFKLHSNRIVRIKFFITFPHFF